MFEIENFDTLRPIIPTKEEKQILHKDQIERAEKPWIDFGMSRRQYDFYLNALPAVQAATPIHFDEEYNWVEREVEMMRRSKATEALREIFRNTSPDPQLLKIE